MCTNLLDSDLLCLTSNKGVLALRGQLFLACFLISVKYHKYSFQIANWYILFITEISILN